MIPVIPLMPSNHPLLETTLDENKWLTLEKNIWRKIFREYFSFRELHTILKVDKVWFGLIIGREVGLTFMRLEAVRKRKGECWLETFANRRILVALDCSRSMKVEAEPWRHEAAMAEIKALFHRFRNSAEFSGITLMHFYYKDSCKLVRHVDEIDGIIPPNLGNTQSWKRNFDAIHSFTKSGGRPTVFLLSDLESRVDQLVDHDIWNTRLADEPLNLYLCRVGNSPKGKEFIEGITGKGLTNDTVAGEPPKKKSKQEIQEVCNIALSYKHISSKDCVKSEYTFLRAPTVFLEEVEEDVLEMEEDEPDDMIDHAALVDDDPDYVDDYSAGSDSD